MNKKFLMLLTIVFVPVFIYIAILAINNYKINDTENSLFNLIILIAGFILLSLISDYINKKLNLKPFVILFIIIAIAIALRLLWIFNVNTDLFSDFRGYFDYADEISKGNTLNPNHLYQLFPFTVGYPVMLSLVFKLFGTSLFVGKMFNIFCSVILILLIYLVASRIFDRKSSYSACIIFAVWPTQIMYTSVMATEHIFIIFFLLSVYLAVLIRKTSDTRKYLFSIILGISVLLAQFIRPIAALLLPCVTIYLFVYTEIKDTRLKAVIKKTAVCLIILTSFYIFSGLLNQIVYNMTKVDLSKSSMGFNLLIGTNTSHGGVWNQDDAKIIDDFKGDAEKTQKEALRRGVDRITDNPLAFIKFALVTKVKNLWANEGYGYYWSTQKLVEKSQFTNFMEKNNKLVHSLYQLFYIFILISAIWGTIASFRNNTMDIGLLLLIALSIFGAHLFIEVQGRYAFPALPPLIILAGFGITHVKDNLYIILQKN